MTKFKKHIISKLIRHYESANPLYPLGVAAINNLLFVLYDNLEKTINENHCVVYCYDFKTSTTLQLYNKDEILNPPSINFTAICSRHIYYTFDGKRLIKHIIL